MDSYGGGGDGQILWDWQVGENGELNDASHDVTKFVWDCLNQDDDELLGLLGNQTPLRDCQSLGSPLFDIDDMTCKETLDLEEYRESKRRRLLEYPSNLNGPEDGNQEISSPLVTPEVTEISLLCTDEPECVNWDVRHNSNNLDTVIPLSNGSPNQTLDNYLENCSDGTPMYYSPHQTPHSQEGNTYVDDQTSVSETSEIVSVTESLIVHETKKLSTLKVSKGGGSLNKVKKNLTTSVAYPFTLIKPSWEEGDVTLKDINQRIHAPMKTTPAPQILGTSAFSGKPVVGKTRIRTEGGKGSITILRTRG